MIKIRRCIYMLAAAVLFTAVPTMEAEAAKKIKTVTVSIDGEIEVGQEVSNSAVVIETDSEKYEAGEHTFTNGGVQWEITDEPVLEIVLYAADGYNFSLKEENVYLKGTKAELKSIKRQNASTMLLTVELEPMANKVGSIEHVVLEDTGLAYWDPSMAATGYDVRIYKGGQIMGQTKRVDSNLFHLASLFRKSDNYRVVVRGVKTMEDGTEKTGRWVQSDDVYITADTLDPDAVPSGVEIQGEWMSNEVGRWYQYPDGSYPKNAWVLIFEKWYFFNEEGYMVTGWVDWNGKQYYCGENGEMLVNTVTPDGVQVGLDGSRQ